MTLIIIKSGWKATNIVPYYPKKALNSSQLQIQSQTTSPPPPCTSKWLKMDPNLLYSTPKSQKDILLYIQHLDLFKKLNREGRTILMKAGKALGHSITTRYYRKLLFANKGINYSHFGINRRKSALFWTQMSNLQL